MHTILNTAFMFSSIHTFASFMKNEPFLYAVFEPMRIGVL